MKKFNEMSLRSIRAQLERVGIKMEDDQFASLTHSELKQIYKKSQKAYKLYKQANAIISKKKVPAPAVPMSEDIEEKPSDGKHKIIKGA